LKAKKNDMATHEVITTWAGGMAFDSSIDGHILRMDTKPAGGGNNEGPSPKPLLLSALAGCTGIDVVGMLNKMRVSFSDFSIETRAPLTDEHPRVYTELELIYKIKVSEEDKEKVEKAVNLSEEKYCGVSAMLKKAFPIHFRIEFL
jgi:putative redox protein